jgi:hypothetical protein
MAVCSGVLDCAHEERIESSSEAIWGGIDDVSSDPTIPQAQMDAVVRLQTSGRTCSGTLITPRAVLTAAHCVENTVASDWTVQVGADSKAFKKKKKLGSYVAATMPPQMPQRDVTLMFLDDPVETEAISVRPASNFSQPYNSMLITGWSPEREDGTVIDGGGTFALGDATTGGGYRYRQQKFFTTLTAGTDLSNTASGNAYYWTLNFNSGAGTNEGDSGGPLATIFSSSDPYLNGARVVVGVLSDGNGPVNPTFCEYADVTRGDIATWIASNMLASQHGETHGSNWHSQHATSSSTYWWGERDYTGPCKNGGNSNNCLNGSNGGTDCDCDHWYDHGSTIHDNCPLVANPDQADSNDDGMGDKCQDDQDGDSKKDYEDDCPTVSDAAQIDSNFYAELELALGGSAVCATTGVAGHRPTPNDSQSYIDCWHTWFKGDACDTNATTLNVLGGGVNGETDTCMVIHRSGVPSISYEGSCPAALNTGLGFHSNIGNANGTAANASGTSAPSFCWCPLATSGDWSTIRNNCVLNTTSYKCKVADDSKFPDLTQPVNAQAQWQRITRWTGSNDVLYDALSTNHLQRAFYNQQLDFDTSPVKSTWNFRSDLTNFGQQSTDQTITGMLWTHVVTFTPGSGEIQPLQNYANHYLPLQATKSHSLRVANDWALISIDFSPCPIDPTNDLNTVSVVGFLGGIEGFGTMAIRATEDGISNVNSRFTSSALTVLGSVSSGTYDLLADTAYETPVTGNGQPAIYVDAGTTTIRGALTTSAGGQIDVQSASVGRQSTVSVRTYSSTTNKLYTIETGNLIARDVAAAIGGTASQTSTALTGDSIGTLATMAYSPSQSALFAIDTTTVTGGTNLRLLRIDLNGAVRILWATVTTSSTPTAMLTANGQDALTLGLNTSVGYDAVIMDTTGKPLYSTSDTTTTLKTKPVSDRRTLTLAQRQAFTQDHWDFTIQSKTKSQLASGLCGANWLKSAADSATTLGNPNVDCTGILNGGFETGSLYRWDISGPSTGTSTTVHSGSYSAKLGNVTPTSGDSTIKQIFKVPTTGGTLAFSYSMSCPDTVYYDWFTARLESMSGQTLATIVPNTCASSTAWTNVSYGLASYAGQTIVVVVTSHDDDYYADPSYTLVDDVYVQ